jgi:hypothetical protein
VGGQEQGVAVRLIEVGSSDGCLGQVHVELAGEAARGVGGDPGLGEHGLDRADGPRKEHGWNHRQAVQAGCSPGREHARVRMIFHRPEGDEVFEEGEAYYAGPGHTGE